MNHDIIMPQMGESITEGTISSWKKRVGDKVERDEPLFEISTDKVDAEIPSPASGILIEIRAHPGQTVTVNTVVGVLGDAVAPTKDNTVAVTEDHDTSGSDREPHQPKASPLARKIAAAAAVDIATVTGTGLAGRVAKQDVLLHLSTSRPADALATATLTPGNVADPYQPRILPGDHVEDMSVMRTRIADHMVMSRRISAHVQTVWEADFEKITQLRAKYKTAWKDNHNVKLTYTAFILKAVIDALRAVPTVNASLDQMARKIIFHQHVNLGIAVALDWGLIVPVIHDADELNTLGLARRAADLAERARSKKLKPEEVQAGTFTVTNPGQFGQLFGLPVINQPQVGILGVGAVEKRPVVINDMIAIRSRCYLSLSFDHRLVDGAVAEQFMHGLKKGLEEFDEADLQ